MAKDKEEEDEFEDIDDLTDDDDEDFDLDDDLDLDDATDLTDHELEETLPPVSSPKKEETKKLSSSPATTSSDSSAHTSPAQEEIGSRHLSTRDINVTLIVEIGQIRMPIDKLIALEPGNLLDLNVRADEGVNLVVNGKTIGKGELVRMGDAIGVRILELGR